MGKSFGFVRYLFVQNPKELEAVLGSITFDKLRLKVNLPRFKKGRYINYGVKQTPKPFGINRNRVRMGVSYANVVTNEANKVWQGEEKGNKQWRRIGKTSTGNEWNGLSFNVDHEDMKWLQGGYIGRTFNEKDAFTIQAKLRMDGLNSIKATPLGGNYVLLTAEVDKQINAILEEANDSLSKWFIELIPWNENARLSVRSAWLRITDVPIHAWKLELFNMLANLVGSFVDLDDNTANKRRLDVGRFLISVTSPEIIKQGD